MSLKKGLVISGGFRARRAPSPAIRSAANEPNTGFIVPLLKSFADRSRAAHLAQSLIGRVERAGSVCRVPASDVEKLIIKSVREHLKPCPSIDDRDLITTRLARVEVQPKQLIIHLTGAPSATANRRKTAHSVLRVPWQRTSSNRRREILLPEGMPLQHARPIRSETRATLVAAIARGRPRKRVIHNADARVLDRDIQSSKMVHAALLLLMLGARTNGDPVSPSA